MKEPSDEGDQASDSHSRQVRGKQGHQCAGKVCKLKEKPPKHENNLKKVSFKDENYKPKLFTCQIPKMR